MTFYSMVMIIDIDQELLTYKGTGDVCRIGLLTNLRDKVTQCDRPIIKSGRIPERERCGQGARVQEAGHWGPTELTSPRARASTVAVGDGAAGLTRPLERSPAAYGSEAPAFERISP
jgi:hypothetical protein